ncbi:uncharacterized protein BXZ73DRAFT_38327 [Epithele typhae]|uniref:uncharacterized protein n=1 Tax=Epithele typhae TaxID=378194 RepID=UPI002008386C|nr:uncharacterized protein BXZ73DRAFT_38327 [Epithele typhae]KAH9945458.1 hypothetical protein BXZ73DRAFT_38327 [Epithele typhae]
MARSTKPHRDIKVRVPRHNSQRIGPVLTANVEAVAREKRIRVEVKQTALEPTSALAQAIESASDWNSLLITARAERGPQWDIGTQQFHVDVHSNLYYDPTPLREHMKDEEPPSSSSHPPQRQHPDTVSSSRMLRTGSMQGGMNPQLAQAQMYGGPQGMASPRHGFPPGGNQVMASPYGGMTGIPPGQFYGGDVPPSPMSRGPGMGMNPAMAGLGGGMVMNPGMGMGGMPPDGAMSPEVRRRVTRGMSMDEFGMH